MYRCIASKLPTKFILLYKIYSSVATKNRFNKTYNAL